MHRNLNTILRGIYEKYEGRIRLLSEYVFVVYANSQSTWISNTKVGKLREIIPSLQTHANNFPYDNMLFH